MDAAVEPVLSTVVVKAALLCPVFVTGKDKDAGVKVNVVAAASTHAEAHNPPSVIAARRRFAARRGCIIKTPEFSSGSRKKKSLSTAPLKIIHYFFHLGVTKVRNLVQKLRGPPFFARISRDEDRCVWFDGVGAMASRTSRTRGFQPRSATEAAYTQPQRFAPRRGYRAQ